MAVIFPCFDMVLLDVVGLGRLVLVSIRVTAVISPVHDSIFLHIFLFCYVRFEIVVLVKDLHFH